MKRILLLLADGFEIYEASAFIDVMGWNLLEGDRSTRLYSCGLKKELKSTFDQKFIVDFTLDEINPDEYAALAIPGGFEEYNFYRDAYSNEFATIINQFNERGKPIASICTGAFPIANSGVLKGRPATTYNMNPIRQNNLRSLGAQVINQPIVVTENIITSWNPSTALDVAFLLLEKLTSTENTKNVRRLMGFN